MNFCVACQELDGKHFSVVPHADLAFMSEHGGGMSDLRLMMKSWRCQSCATWMRKHTEYGENPEMWEAVIQLNPWFENGYQVYGEARAMLACKNLEAWYWIEAPGERFPIRSTVTEPVLVGSAFETKFAAISAALKVGVKHARTLPTRPDEATAAP